VVLPLVTRDRCEKHTATSLNVVVEGSTMSKIRKCYKFVKFCWRFLLRRTNAIQKSNTQICGVVLTWKFNTAKSMVKK